MLVMAALALLSQQKMDKFSVKKLMQMEIGESNF